jgi:hypothetical protein
LTLPLIGVLARLLRFRVPPLELRVRVRVRVHHRRVRVSGIRGVFVAIISLLPKNLSLPALALSVDVLLGDPVNTPLAQLTIRESRVKEVDHLKLVMIVLRHLDIGIYFPFTSKGVVYHDYFVVIFHHLKDFRLTPFMSFFKALRIEVVVPILVGEEVICTDRGSVINLRADKVCESGLSRTTKSSDNDEGFLVQCSLPLELDFNNPFRLWFRWIPLRSRGRRFG